MEKQNFAWVERKSIKRDNIRIKINLEYGVGSLRKNHWIEMRVLDGIK
jgi:hypothetical protein